VLLLLVAPLGLAGSSCERVKPPRHGETGLQAGACAVEITPLAGVNHTDPIYMAGFSNDRQATGVHDPLWARGVVLESGGTKIGLVTLDVVGYFNNEIRTIRSLVDPARGFDSITVSSTHNHEGPDTMGLWGPDETTTGADPGYLDFVNDRVVECLSQADDDLAPAAVKFATGSTAESSLPPWPDLVADGKILEALTIDLSFFGQGVFEIEGDPGPILNASLPVMQLRRYVPVRERVRALIRWIFQRGDFPDLHPLGTTIATVVNFASHPESLGSDNTLITSDFPHAMREALEGLYGGVAIYVSADLGVLQGPLDVDVPDADSGDPVPRRTFEFAERMGEILAARATDALEHVRHWDAAPAIETTTDGPFFLEVENPFFIVLGQLGVFGRRQILEQGDLQGIETEVQVMKIGEASFVVTPNELDPQIGELYRERIGEERHRFTIGLGNDEIGYQMPEAKFNPTCFACVVFVLTGNDDLCPAAETLDCSTTMQNNVGPGADPVLQDRIGGLIDASHP
jgi:hypothetical protein